ncbi:MAG: ATP-dependent DNA helicase PcrA [Planctomycetes bacterium ADurb.Bin126]|nr:MAG: ATP-dependent DNA helicase PcrA [Planctomycetes bacterium ADurb.Bin126]HOD83771.1 UvrD-helicase domain-containing protein [Phycisphaerae bacterium]HQL72988.1 UvrD-helicase domain-containing protein [Phycisphaerae bacterium]
MEDLLTELNEPQREAVVHVDGPLLVLAGAGSGKTRVITRRVAYLVRQGIAPWNVLAITFTNKAAGEMRERVEALGTPRGVTVCTFHALCARLLREFAAQAGLEPSYSIYDRDDQLRLAKEAMKRAQVSPDRHTPSRVLGSISNAKNDLHTPQDIARQAQEQSSGYLDGIARSYAEYQKLLRESNALDFDDLLLRTVLLLRDCPDIRELLGRRYRYVLVDEYQDTNRAQYYIAHGIVLGQGEDVENICVTGDPDQSIYAWRGADVSNILEFERDYPDAKVVRLEENYRSTAPILTTASHLIAHNKRRKKKDLWTRREGGDDVHVVYCDDEHAEAREIARRITRLRTQGRDYSDIAVFYRVNSLSRVMEETLMRQGLPYRIARGVEFYNRREIKDVLAYLKIVVNPRDDLACERIINVPARGIGQTTVSRLRELAARNALGLLEACGQGAQAGLNAGAVRKTAAFAELIARLADWQQGRSAREVVEEVVRQSGIQKALEEGDEEESQARANLDELITTAAEFDINNPGQTLADYLHQVSLVSDVDHFDGAGGAVTLMTLHAAKGLEFPAVFIIGCEENLLPFGRPSESTPGRWVAKSGGELEEERRLAFVGMTRARDVLTLSCARRRMMRGMYAQQAASPFLGEIGEQHVAVEDMTAPPSRPVREKRRGGFYGDVADRERIEALFDRPASRRHRGETFSQAEETEINEAEQDEVPMPPEYQYLRVGSRVHHATFGWGKVTRLSQPWPQTRAEVFFENIGPKKLVLAHAHLTMDE